MRSRPAALDGLKPVTPEPWATDEAVYNLRFETRDVGERHGRPDETFRKHFHQLKVNAYLERLDSKYAADVDARH